MRLYTIGFTRKPAARFFGLLRQSAAERLVDVRLNNVSQLSGFAKRDDLAYFLRKICRMEYVHRPDLAPTKELLDGYRKEHKDWAIYERQFIDLLEYRCAGQPELRNLLANSCLLCSEDQPRHCHRRLVAEYLQRQWPDIEIIHLV